MPPFNASSPWNTRIPATAAFQSATGAETARLRSTDKAYPWIGQHAFGVYQATDADPLAPWSYKSFASSLPTPGGLVYPSGTIQLRTPKGIKFCGSDGWAVLIEPAADIAWECWLGAADGKGGYTAAYLVQTDLLGNGLSRRQGQSEGVRAFGGSLLGGLVRKSELDEYAIPHAIAMAASEVQLSKTGMVWPAMFTDRGGDNDHTGVIPMGARFAIPPSVSLSSLGLKTPEGMALARAYRDFGGYITDTATGTLVLAYLEEGCTDAQTKALEKDIRAILNALCMVMSVG